MSRAFQLFGLPVQFDLNAEQLHQQYRTLAAQFHPDRFAAASAFEQKQAMMMSAAINQAYEQLSHPLNRAAELLRTQNIDADAPEHTSFAPEFLMQQMQWRETLMDAQMEQDEAAMLALDSEIAAEQQTLLIQLRQAFEQQQYESAAQLVRQGRFLDKMRQEIASALP
ncbi:Fe-S protein assembly co-chaperone HscB [Kingella kingae]|uniref:Fe-S protein assembly co-chaperone HscB n=1 Tax=Kingella kingae TaxID=504 RepID=UPI000412BF64|nr:Fe-S protein assembly co-chaperone HscB [Kingella kingae]MDK4574309.1 Fe-S protein assembly co-chaperone HscB [Kingella kingae]MDK4606463.1 Fe-S protein assembly co-chaperone HscB [Kingella kingae]MDK4625296.1 Fe-S protein assembly co-chaperone HscB [Kingella kingae]MDK4660996.1 Fe-S protein assembly co-chaperone HscB [Kingella kingae]MDK4668893.1 Fe-S protein assembly co-chaperone HscB [Kingella kingae]